MTASPDPARSLSLLEFAAELRAEVTRAKLTLQQLADRIDALDLPTLPKGLSKPSLGEYTSSGKHPRLPTDEQLRIVLRACRTHPDRARRLLAARATFRASAPRAPETVPLPAPFAQHEVVVHLFAPTADVRRTPAGLTRGRCGGAASRSSS